jgi:outer membrane murein-binding lipoprotein Lpp
MKSSDVRVFGLVVGTYVLSDIGMAVPYGREVLIPGDKAVRSKDLQKGLSQRCLFQLPDNPPSYTAPATFIRDDVLQERIRSLELQVQSLTAHNTRLESENDQLRESVRAATTHGDRLDTILQAIQQRGVSVVHTQGERPAQVNELADGTAPQFLPAEITPKNAEVRIHTVTEAGSANIADAAERLRKLRRGGS